MAAVEHKLFVRNLPWSCDDTVLRDTFAAYGEVTFSRLAVDQSTGKSRGYGFVSFGSAEEADAARTALDKSDLDGRTIEVQTAQPREAGASRPPRESYGARDSYSARPKSAGVCYAFQRGECTRGDSCRFSHEAGGAAEGGSGARTYGGSSGGKPVCRDFQNGRCSRGDSCRFNHDVAQAPAGEAGRKKFKGRDEQDYE